MANLYLREQDKAVLLQLLAQYLPDVSAWVYGSRVNGTAHEASDLDIVLRSKDLTPIDYWLLEAFSEAVRESNIPILVEARDWTRLPKSFHAEILKNYVVLKEAENLAGIELHY
jgi:predicted nucleotidyltransferase